MSERKPFLMRVDAKLLEQLERWAADDLRSVNGQIEFLLRRALADSGRVKEPKDPKNEAKNEARLVPLHKKAR